MHDTSLFKQLISILYPEIRARSGLGFFHFLNFPGLSGCGPDYQRQELLSGGSFGSSVRSICVLHKSSYSSPAVAAVAVQVGFQREAGRVLSGFPQDSIMISSRFHHDFVMNFFAGSASCETAKTVLILEGILIFFTGFFAPHRGKIGMLTPYI